MDAGPMDTMLPDELPDGRVKCPDCPEYYFPRGMGTHKKKHLEEARKLANAAKFIAQHAQEVLPPLQDPDSESDSEGHELELELEEEYLEGNEPDIGVGDVTADFELESIGVDGGWGTHNDDQDEGSDDSDDGATSPMPTNFSDAEFASSGASSPTDEPMLPYDVELADPSESQQHANRFGLSSQDFESLVPGDVICRYHRFSGKATEIIRQAAFNEPPILPSGDQIEQDPHRGFTTRDDFELAEFILDASLNTKLTEGLFRIINKLRRGLSNITLASVQELNAAWEVAEKLEENFTAHTIEAQYKREPEPRRFEVHARNTWNHLLKQIADPLLAPYMHYDAARLYRFDGTRAVRFVTEPYTADMMWEYQEALGPYVKPIMVIVYSDDAKFSTFGTQKGHSVVVSLANLDSSVRHGKGLGASTLVGWLPVVPRNAAEEGKAGWANFKTDVWHKSMKVVLESLVKPSSEGYAAQCGDGNVYVLGPTVKINIVDYKEAIVAATNRGLRGKAPCPVCLVKSEHLASLRYTETLRTHDMAFEIVDDDTKTRTAKHNILKEKGLRLIENAFWALDYCNIHEAISFDRLHAYHLGLFSKHLLPLLQDVIAEMDRHASVKVDDQVAAFPRWSGFHHFSGITQMTFNDGSKFEAISKIIILVAHNVITSRNHLGYQILKCIFRFQVMDMYTSFDLHTEDTIRLLFEAQREWDSAVQELIQMVPEKMWDFIKIHSHCHAPFDIFRKGVSKNFNAKPYEKLHGPLRKIYLRQTNFKNVASQILNVAHRQLVACVTRARLDFLDEISDETKVRGERQLFWQFDSIYLGSQTKTTFEAIENAFSGDHAFSQFRLRCVKFMRNLLGSNRVNLTEAKLWECRQIRATYVHEVTQKITEDLLHCSPSFHKSERQDGILYMDSGEAKFGKLLHVFALDMDKCRYGVALILPLDAPRGPSRTKDADLGLCRIHAPPRSKSIFIQAAAIVRGVLIMQDIYSELENEYYVVDKLDGDIFQRCRSIFVR